MITNTENLTDNPFRILKAEIILPSGIISTLEMITIEESLDVAIKVVEDLVNSKPYIGQLVRVYQ